MGGGAVVRSMARLVGAATVGAAAVPTAGAFCHVQPQASTSMRDQESVSALLSHSKKGYCDLNINAKGFGPSTMDVRFEHEECECSWTETEEGGQSLRRLVFSSPPSEEEVEEATKELHAALHLCLSTQGSSKEEYRPELMVEDDMDVTTPRAFIQGLPSASSFTVNHFEALAAENSSVMQAFQLLQTNPKVQDVVKSLACDPAVWNAVLSNEKVLELTEEDSQEYDIDEENDGVPEMDESSEVALTSKLYGLVMTRTRVYYGCVKGKIFSILRSMFGSMEHTIFLKAGGRSTKDKTVASCMMLAVAVLLVVVMRRRVTRQ